MIDLLRSAAPELLVGAGRVGGRGVRRVLYSGYGSNLAMFAMWTILRANEVSRLSKNGLIKFGIFCCSEVVINGIVRTIKQQRT
jgi:hypothetical protein